MARRKPSRSALALRWVGAAVLLIIVLSYIHPLGSYRHAQDEVAKRKAAIARLQQENEAFGGRLSLAGKTEFMVREARRLGLVRPGERLFIVKGIENWKGRAIR
ncbi:MAG: septum formation initiator family protein [Gaiellaceae bacterium]